MIRRIALSLVTTLALAACQDATDEVDQAVVASCTAAATTTTVPVAKDAAVIYASLGLGVVPGRNFGSASSVDIGEYHLTSEGLFGYSLAGLVPADAVVTQAELVVPAPFIPGGASATFRLNRITSAWDESTVTWQNKPSYQFVREIALKAGVENRVDVTDLIAGGELSLALQPSSSAPSTDNVFIDAKEKSGGHPTTLVVTWHP
jgi:hypothetical protein